MTARRRVSAILLAASLGTAAAAGPAAPGHAAPPASCTFSDTVCVFDGTGYTGARFTASSPGAGGTCVSLAGHGWGNGRARSVYNTNSTPAALFALDNCAGGPFQVGAGSGVTNLGSFQANSVWVP